MTAPRTTDPDAAAAVLGRGGVIAYPTEGVWGLGCDPSNDAAVARILALKGRPGDKGLILIAGDLDAITELVADDEELQQALPTWPGPVTWVFTAARTAPPAVCRPDGSIALRWTDHALAGELCRAAGMAIVSTSANRAGRPPALTADAVDEALGVDLDAILEGELGDAGAPSTIRDARSGEVLRAGTTPPVR